MAFKENPRVFLRHFGRPCVCDGKTFTGLLWMPGELMELSGVPVQSTGYTLQALTEELAAAGVQQKSLITVDGSLFMVREAVPMDDGVFSTLNLTRKGGQP